MSLVAFAIRVATCRVLAEVLPASFKVLDSPQDPVALLDETNPTPFVAVYTGYAKVAHQARELLGGSAEIALTIQIFIPDAFAVQVGGQSIRIDTRKQGADTALDVLWRIICRGLLQSQTAWGAVWRGMVLLTPETESSSYLVEHASVRAIAREVSIKCDPVHEPVPGGAPEGVWADLVAAMQADTGTDGLRDLVGWISAEISGGASLPQGERDRVYLGISDYAAGATGVVPMVGTFPVVDGATELEVPADLPADAPLVPDAG